MNSPKCAFCRTPITASNDSWEHIIPNSIGGRKRIKGFICRECNSNRGQDWDTELTKWLNPLSLYLGINRQRGQNPAQNISTLSGSEVRLNPDGTLTIPNPQIIRTSQAGTTSINVKARTPEEMQTIVKNILKKTPQLAGTDPEDLLKTASETATFASDPMLILTQLECPTDCREIVS